MREMSGELKERPMGHHSMRRFQRRWFNNLVPLIAQEQEDIQNRVPSVDRNMYGCYFNILPPEVLRAMCVFRKSSICC